MDRTITLPADEELKELEAFLRTDADTGTAWCRLGGEPHHGVFTLALAPWPAATVLRCPLTALPVQGRLSVRDVRVLTRMGRTVRYLVPAFASS
jgi:hypothetical protein